MPVQMGVFKTKVCHISSPLCSLVDFPHVESSGEYEHMYTAVQYFILVNCVIWVLFLCISFCFLVCDFYLIVEYCY